MEEPHSPQSSAPEQQANAPVSTEQAAPSASQSAAAVTAAEHTAPGQGTFQQSPAPAQRVRHTLHHSYIWLGTVRALPYLIMVLVVSAGSVLSSQSFSSSSEIFGAVTLTLLVCVVPGVLILALILGGLALTYKYIWYEFGASEFSYYSGIISKHRTHVPYQKVQSVNEKASLLQRVAGVCTVRIETAGGAENKAVVLSYVERSAAERIRRELFMRKNLLNAGLSSAEVDARMAQADAQAVLSGAAPMPGTGAPGQAPAAPWDLEAARGAQAAATAPANPAAEANVLDVPANVADDMRGLFAGAEVDTGQVTCEYGLTNKELVLSAVTGKSSFMLVLIGVVATISSLISTLADFRLVSDEMAAYRAAGDVLSTAYTQAGWAVIGFVIGAIVLMWLISLAGTCLAYGGFRSRRRGQRIEVERGIITHQFSGMDIGRIQSINVQQSFFQRILGYCSVSYGRVGAYSDEESAEGADVSELQQLVVHPFLPLSRVQEVVSSLTPEYAELPQPNRTVSPKALRRAITRRAVLQGFGFWLAVVDVVAVALLNAFAETEWVVSLVAGFAHAGISLTAVFSVVLVLALVIFVAEAIGAALWYRRAAFGFDERYVTIVNGGYSVDTVTVPRTKIQLASTRTNPLQRHAGVATVMLRSAAGVGGKRERLIDVTAEDAEMWLAWARPHGGRSV